MSSGWGIAIPMGRDLDSQLQQSLGIILSVFLPQNHQDGHSSSICHPGKGDLGGVAKSSLTACFRRADKLPSCPLSVYPGSRGRGFLCARTASAFTLRDNLAAISLIPLEFQMNGSLFLALNCRTACSPIRKTKSAEAQDAPCLQEPCFCFDTA